MQGVKIMPNIFSKFRRPTGPDFGLFLCKTCGFMNFDKTKYTVENVTWYNARAYNSICL